MMVLYMRDECDTCSNSSCEHHGEGYGHCHRPHLYIAVDWFKLIEEFQYTINRAVKRWKASEIKISGARIHMADEIIAELEGLGGK